MLLGILILHASRSRVSNLYGCLPKLSQSGQLPEGGRNMLSKAKAPFLGKVVLVTGSGSGIGRATALAFGQAGAFVMLNGRKEEKLQHTREQFAQQGLNVDYCVADVQYYEHCQALVKSTIERFGRLDVVIANASSSQRSEFIRTDPAIFRHVLESNILSAAYIAHAALPSLVESQGSLVLVSSLAGLIGLPTSAAYSAGKMALTALTQSLRTEVAATGVHVGIAYVGFTRNDPDKRVFDAQGRLVPVAPRESRLQQTQEEVARAIVRMVYRRQSRTVLSSLGKLLWVINALSPTLAERGVRWSYRRFPHMYHG